MKNSEGLYLSAREAAAELAISPATLYAYVSRGLVRSEPTPDSRKNRYRAEDVRALKERRVPSPEPRGLRSFDADLPVMDTEISTITEEGAIYRGVNCVDLAENDTLEHTATLLWDVSGVDPFAPDNFPAVSDEMRLIAQAARRAAPIDRAIAVLALASSADPRAFTRAHDGRAMVGAASSGSWSRPCSIRSRPPSRCTSRSPVPGLPTTSTRPISYAARWFCSPSMS